MLSMRSWRHERRVTPSNGRGSTLVDRITFTPRIPGTGAILSWFTRLLFRHRHAKLRAMFDGS
jgi:ligand-binding SRPBCC domain-containing protein